MERCYELNVNRRVSRKREKFAVCIFCNGSEQLTLFKGKLVCRHCLHHIPNLFLPLIK